MTPELRRQIRTAVATAAGVSVGVGTFAIAMFLAEMAGVYESIFDRSSASLMAPTRNAIGFLAICLGIHVGGFIGSDGYRTRSDTEAGRLDTQYRTIFEGVVKIALYLILAFLPLDLIIPHNSHSLMLIHTILTAIILFLVVVFTVLWPYFSKKEK